MNQIEILLPEKPVIATDIDGVVLNWASNLPFFAAEFNLPTDVAVQMLIDGKFRSPAEMFQCSRSVGDEILKQYNSSKWIRGLKGYTDALIYINKMKERYDFVAITAIGTDFSIAMNRMSNLNVLFPGAFKDVLICDHHQSKDTLFYNAKSKYSDRIVCYIDDLSTHCQDAIEVWPDIPVMRMVRGDNKPLKSDVDVGVRTVYGWASVEHILNKEKFSD